MSETKSDTVTAFLSVRWNDGTQIDRTRESLRRIASLTCVSNIIVHVSGAGKADLNVIRHTIRGLTSISNVTVYVSESSITMKNDREAYVLFTKPGDSWNNKKLGRQIKIAKENGDRAVRFIASNSHTSRYLLSTRALISSVLEPRTHEEAKVINLSGLLRISREVEDASAIAITSATGNAATSGGGSSAGLKKSKPDPAVSYMALGIGVAGIVLAAVSASKLRKK